MNRPRPWLFCVALLAAPLAMPATASGEQSAKPARSDELELQRFNASSQAAFKKTKRSIEDRLASLDDKANHLFDQGTEIAIAAMTAFVQERLAPFKSALFGTPPEADQIYAEGKMQFEQDMKVLTVRVANVMADEIAGAKAEIRRAEAIIAAEQGKLPASVRARAAKQQADLASKLGALADRASAAQR